MPLWWNWQTRGTQNPFFARKYRFESDQWYYLYVPIQKNKDIIKAQGRYFCSEKHIKSVNKANPDFSNHPRIDYGYGTCTKDGWVR